MTRRIVRTLPALAVLWLISTVAGAQELRIYTQVYNEGSVATRPDQRPPVIARSLTLFHAGKVYDYIDSVGELTIFEPAHHRFTILNGTHEPVLATVVTFDEIRQILKVGHKETEDYVERLQQQGDPISRKVIEPLRFQLAPKFEEHYDSAKHRLQLTSSSFRYDVQCAEVESPETVETYLHYADWAAQLNYVLHPQALFPAPRLALNDTLRKHNVVPVAVELRADFERRLHLRAEHQLHWDFNAKDRSDINHWESLLKGKKIRFVPLREYQQSLLAGQMTNRR